MATRNGSPPAAERIRKISKEFGTGTGRRAAHLANIALAAFKDLIVNAESDDIRFRAAQALIMVPPVARKLELMQDVIQPQVMDRKTPNRPAVLGARLKRLMDAGSEQANEALRLIEEAEKEAGLTANPREPRLKTFLGKAKP